MIDQTTMLKGIAHGRTIELERDLGLSDGEAVMVMIGRMPQSSSGASLEEIASAELWADRIVFDSAVSATERVVKGTRLTAESLLAELEPAQSDERMLQVHPELVAEDLTALHAYARVPPGFRQSFGAWAEDADELDRFIEEAHRRRRIRHRAAMEPFEP